MSEENLEKKQLSTYKARLNEFKARLEKEVKNLDYDRNEGLKEEDLYETRR